MSNRVTGILLVVVVIAMSVPFALNFLGLYWEITPEKFLPHNNVCGMAIEHHGKLYTLNFDQQNRVVSILNRAVKIGYETYFESEEGDFAYDRLIIYRCDEENLELTPEGFMNRQLLFKIPEWNPQGLLRETGPGELHPLLSQTYDP